MNDASTRITLLYTLVSLALVAGGFFVTTVTYFVHRRVTAGQISTSDTNVPWQPPAMREMPQQEKGLAEEQRNKMIEIDGQVFSMLENINYALVKIDEFRRNIGHMKSVGKASEEGISEAAAKAGEVDGLITGTKRLSDELVETVSTLYCTTQA